MRTLLLFSFVVLISACGKYYHLTDQFKNQSQLTEKCIRLDSNYDYYIRQLYRSTDQEQKQQSNFAEKRATDSLLEIEYLFISNRDSNVLYISTVPDKFQQYYSDPTRYLGESFVNIYDFKKFSFGSLKGYNSFEFISKNGKDKDIWNIYYTKTSENTFITINTVEQILNNQFVDLVPVNRALEKDISFKKVTEPYEIVFYRNEKRKKTIQKDSAICSNRKICIKKSGKNYTVYFTVDSEIDKWWRIVYFENKRIAYSPDPVFR